jgi:hypothetical protein
VRVWAQHSKTPLQGPLQRAAYVLSNATIRCVTQHTTTLIGGLTQGVDNLVGLSASGTQRMRQAVDCCHYNRHMLQPTWHSAMKTTE